jgi:hypothetical protein
MEKTAKLQYLLSEAGRKASLLAGGDGKEIQVITTEITPAIIELATVDTKGEVALHVGYRPETRGAMQTMYPERVIVLVEVSQDKAGEWTLKKREDVQRFDYPQTVELLLAWESLRQHQVAAAKKLFEGKKGENEILWKRQSDERQAREENRRELIVTLDAQRDERKAKEAEAKKAYEADRAAWIEANGSDYLKQGLGLGYNINRSYVDDRAAVEYPTFQVARGDDWNWGERINPTPEALVEVSALIEAGVKAEIVFLKEAPGNRDEGGYREFDPCEAIMIHGYLGKYDLIKF